MARPKGILQVNGTLGELSFYDSVYGPIVRTKGGPSAEQIKKSKKFVRVREHNAEFKGCAVAGKALRIALHPLLKHVKDHRLVWRVTKLMSDLKNADIVSVRGKRNVMQGLATNEGKALLKNFDFNSQAVLDQILVKKIKVDSAGAMSLKGLKPVPDLKSPKGATYVSFKGARLRVDLVKEKAELFESREVKLKLDKKASDVLLNPGGKPTFAGADLYLVHICFLQEINGVDYLLSNGEFTALSVVGVK